MDTRRKAVSNFLSEVIEERDSLPFAFDLPTKTVPTKSKMHRNVNIGLTLSVICGYIFIFMRMRPGEGNPYNTEFNYTFYTTWSISAIALIWAFLTSSPTLNNYLTSASLYSIGTCLFCIAMQVKEALMDQEKYFDNPIPLLIGGVNINGDMNTILEGVMANVDLLKEDLDKLYFYLQQFCLGCFTSIIYCNVSYLAIEKLNWVTTIGFVVSGSTHIYFMLDTILGPDFRNSVFMLFTSILLFVVSFKYYLNSIVWDLNQRNAKLSKIQHFYFEWLLTLNSSYLLIKDGEVLFSNTHYDENMKNMEEKCSYVVDKAYLEGIKEGMTWKEVGEVVSSKETLAFTKIAVFSKGDTYLECNARKYKSGFIELFLGDITDSIRQDKQKIENNYRNTVFAKVAHEFKTPITNIVLLIDSIKSKITSKEVQNDLDMLKGLSDYVTFLMSDITTYFTSSTKIKLVPEVVELDKICNFSVNVLKSLIESKSSVKKSVSARLISNYNGLLMIDQVRMKQILLNYLSNAAKFTTHGEITLKTELNGDFIEISVEDQGIGIPPDRLEQLRSRDELKFEVRDEYNKMGSGLGMSISKQMCDEMGLEFKIDSEQGKGTKVAVRIPRKDFEIENETDISKETVEFTGPYLYCQEEEQKVKPEIVVVVDDNTMMRRAVRAMIEQIAKSKGLNWTVLEIEDGIFAVNEIVSLSLKGAKVKFLITDEFMDFLNGSDSIEIIKKLMDDQRIARFPCFSCSAFEDENFKEKVIGCGADQLIPKPATKDALVEALIAEELVC